MINGEGSEFDKGKSDFDQTKITPKHTLEASQDYRPIY